MSDNTTALLIFLPMFALMAYLVHAISRSQTPSAPISYELRSTLDQILSLSRKIEGALDQQRRVLNDAHKRISAVTKGVGKQTSQTQSDQQPDLHDPAVPQTVPYETQHPTANAQIATDANRAITG